MKRFFATIMGFVMVAAAMPAAMSAETPAMVYEGTGDLLVERIAVYATGAEWDEGGAEIVAFDPVSGKALLLNGAAKAVDILDLGVLAPDSGPMSGAARRLEAAQRVRLEHIGITGISDITSVAASPAGNVFALSLPAEPAQDDGRVAFLDAEGRLLGSVRVGALPDMVTFTPDGRYVLTANEGEPSADYGIDPRGGVSIIDVGGGFAGIAQSAVRTIYFEDETVIGDGVRIAKPGAAYAEDLEPEYIAVSPDSKTAYVTLQENNAIAVLDIAAGKFTSVRGLGYKDHSAPGNGMDPSDQDGETRIGRWPALGMYMPDGIDLFDKGGKTYLVTANEGDAREYETYDEETRVEDIKDRIRLNAAHYKGFTEQQLDEMASNGLFDAGRMGRLKLSAEMGKEADGHYSALYSFGARSFSIWDASDLSLVYDSGDQMERTLLKVAPEQFNADNGEPGGDDRSDDKGPEPEGVTVGKVGDRLYAFVGLERMGGVMAYNISDPGQPVLSVYFSTREFAEEGGDSGPEGLQFVAAENSPTGEALLLVAHEVSGTLAIYELKAAPHTTRIVLLHTNDSHGRIEEGDMDGMGFAALAELVRRQRADNPHTLLLDAGDTFHGTTFATLVRGASVAEVMNEVGYDAMTAGNHDFNYGYERLLELKDIVDFPIVSANVKDTEGGRLLEPYVIREAGGIKLGIFGLATPETTYKTHPKNVEGLVFTDPVQEAEAVVAELKDRVDAVIALTHLGIDAASTDTSIRLAREVPGIDLIVDGHSHSTLVEGLPGENDTLIVSAGEYTKNLGVVELVFDEGKNLIGKKAHLINKEEAASVDPDPAVADLIDAVKRSQETVLAEGIGKTAVRLDGERERVRAGETNLGNLITDAMLDLTGADAAITNGGGIRASIEAGEITKGDVINVLPFGNYIVTKRIGGADLKAALENGIDAYPEPKGAFPHVAGMTYRIDPAKPEGRRATDIRIKGEPLDPNRSYLIATNDFMAAGGDEYTMFADDPVVNEYPALDETLIAYIQKMGGVAPKEEGRIAEVGGAQPDGAAQPDAGDGAAKEERPHDGKMLVHIVKKGDTLWAIGRRYNTTWQELARINNLANPHLIFPGQRIVIGN